MSGDFVEYMSCDSIHGGEASEEHYPVEFLNSIETGGLPPHVLRLRPGVLLMVIRNYAPHLGVCNGTLALAWSASGEYVPRRDCEMLMRIFRGCAFT